MLWTKINNFMTTLDGCTVYTTRLYFRIDLVPILRNSRKLYAISSSGFFKALFERREATIFGAFTWLTNARRFLRPSCTCLVLRKNSILKLKAVKQGHISYNASSLPGQSLIFVLPTLLKLIIVRYRIFPLLGAFR